VEDKAALMKMMESFTVDKRGMQGEIKGD